MENRVPIYKRIISFIIDFAIVMLFASAILSILPKNSKYNEVIDRNKELQEMVIQKKIENKEFVQESMKLTYDSYKYGLLENGITIVLMISYFTCFIYFNHGKTPGKMICKYEVKAKDGNNPTFLGSLARTLLISRTFGDIISIILVYTMSQKTFIGMFNYVDMVITTLWLTCPFVAMFREDGRGLHDLVGKTIVVNKRKRPDDQIVEAQIEEKKEEKIVVKKEEKTTKKTNKKNNKNK
jgi:uncharacterized RDD family membrane protein YckC